MTTLVHTQKELRKVLAQDSGSVGLVMTMGALHDGHLSLVDEARKQADRVVVTIFVNPQQFGPNEDFAEYPRTLQADLAKLEGVDVVYAPSVEEVYPRAPRVRVTPGVAGEVLEGYLRPGHFDGVLQVVAKVLNQVRPNVAVFGQKDAQQFVNITQMVADLDMPVKLVEAPIIREESGLAMSSRNEYLSRVEREQAAALHAALRLGQDAAQRGASPAEIVAATADHLLEVDAEHVVPQYVALVAREGFEVLALWTQGEDTLGVASLASVGLEDVPAYLTLAAHVGKARLIDNVKVQVTGLDH